MMTDGRLLVFYTMLFKSVISYMYESKDEFAMVANFDDQVRITFAKLFC